MCVDLPLDKKTVENQDWATGPLGLRAAGPSRAVGRGPLGRGPAFSKTRFQEVFSTTADAMLFRQNTRKTGNNTVHVPSALFERFTDLNQFKYAFNVHQNWETDERDFAWSRHRILPNSQFQE